MHKVAQGRESDMREEENTEVTEKQGGRLLTDDTLLHETTSSCPLLDVTKCTRLRHFCIWFPFSQPGDGALSLAYFHRCGMKIEPVVSVRVAHRLTNSFKK